MCTLGMPEVIATGVLSGPSGVLLVDPGPTSSLAGLTAGLESAGISWQDVTTLLITHIHLDHSGACGTLVRDHPGLRIYVHERGAPHLVNPEKLLASATRLYGRDMDILWGEVLPVPESNLTVLRGGERLEEGGRTLEVAIRPARRMRGFCRRCLLRLSATAGVRLPGGAVIPPTSRY